MKRSAAIAGVLVASLFRHGGTPAAADSAAAPAPLTLRWTEHWNRHDREGAMGGSLESVVTVQLLAGGKVRVEDRGTAQQRDLARLYYKEDNTRWRNVWVGSWTQTAQSLVLSLTRAERHCAADQTYRGSPTKSAECEPASEAVQLQCAAEVLRVGAEFVSADPDRQQQPVWRCLPTGSDSSLGGTPLPWVLGQKRCIATTKSNMRLLHSLCPKRE